VLHFDGTSWTQQTATDLKRTTNNALSSVSCLSSTDCTAVGFSDSGTQHRALVERWNGATWSVVPIASPAGSVLLGVSCVSTSFCMAVGTQATGQTSGVATKTFITRWNGTSWFSQTSVNPATYLNTLADVSCPTTTSCAAVGSQEFTSAPVNTLVERFDGESWRLESSPTISGATNTRFADVRCVDASNCIAVGSSFKSTTGTTTLTEKWTGSTWTIVTSPNANSSGKSNSSLLGVSCTSSNRCTAVGGGAGASPNYLSLAERWSGTTWTLQSTPNLSSSTFDQLNAVACTSAILCQAVGEATVGGPGHVPLAEMWNGSTWVLLSTQTPAGATSAPLGDISCVAATCFAVGASLAGGVSKTLVERLQ
jgi:hypothetical protein